MEIFKKVDSLSPRIRFFGIYLISIVLIMVLLISLGMNTSHPGNNKGSERNENDQEELQLINTNRLLREKLVQINRLRPSLHDKAASRTAEIKLGATQAMRQSIDSIEASGVQFMTKEGKSGLYQILSYYKSELQNTMKPEATVTVNEDHLVQNESKDLQRLTTLQKQFNISLSERDQTIASLKRQLQSKTIEMMPANAMVSAPAKGGTIQDLRQSNINLSLGFKSLQNKIWSMTREYNELLKDHEQLKNRLIQLQKNGGSE